MSERDTVATVVEQKLCNTCGACAAVCPVDAIRFSETVGGYVFPVIDWNTCTHCGLCVKVCPGILFSRTLKANMPSDPFVGQCLGAWVGRATDDEFYRNAQSGGVVAALLAHALDSGFADAVLTVRMGWGAPPRPEAVWATSRQEILESQKSKYCPVPALEQLKGIAGTHKKIVVVGVSCQVHGLLNLLDVSPVLKRNVALVVGLICDRTLTCAAVDFLVHKTVRSLEPSHVRMIFRDKQWGGYPGDVHVEQRDGSHRVMPEDLRIRIKDAFTPARCRLCFDKMNVYSDLTIGDPHGIAGVNRRDGESVAIVRTPAGREFFNQVLSGDKVRAREVGIEEVVGGQDISSKRVEWRGYMNAWAELGRPLPDYGPRPDLEGEKGEAARWRTDLRRALSLDGFKTRHQLLAAVGRQLWRKTLVRWIRAKLRAARRAWDGMAGNVLGRDHVH